METNQLLEFDRILQPFLPENRVCHLSFVKNPSGYKGGALRLFDPRMEFSLEFTEDFKFHRTDARQLLRNFLGEVEVGFAHYFILQKGKTPVYWSPDEKQTEQIIHRALVHSLESNNAEAFQIHIRFFVPQHEEDYGIHEVESSQKKDGEWETLNAAPYFSIKDDLELLRNFCDPYPEEMMVEVSREEMRITSQPAKPEKGWASLDKEKMQGGGKVQERKNAIQAARDLRMKHFREFGEVEELVMAPLIGPIFTGGYNWPAGRPQFRVIHTPNSTLVISDGMSDPFENEKNDPDLAYNGWTLEFYLEFPGRIEFDQFTGHYALAALTQITQTAIGHGGVEGALKEHGIMSVTMNNEALSKPYANKNGEYGILLNVPSPNVPASIPLNLEKEVLLVSVTLITRSELSKVEKGGGASRTALAESRKASGKFNYNPFEV